MLALLHPPESDAYGARHARGDIARGKAGLALGHLFMRTAQTIPPRSALGRTRQRATDNRLDLLEAQDELGELLPGEVVPQGVIVIHGRRRQNVAGKVPQPTVS